MLRDMSMAHSPILIASPTRSGTTMIAWLLHLHGAWIGKADVTKAPETNPQVGTENTELKKYLKSVPDGSIPGDFREQILSRVETDGPWLLKTAATLTKQEAWIRNFPDAKWLLPDRPIDDIVESAMRHPGFKKAGRERRRKIAENHRELQMQVASNANNSMWVDVDAIANRDEEKAREMVEFCGLEFNRDIFLDWIQPERWHGA